MMGWPRNANEDLQDAGSPHEVFITARCLKENASPRGLPRAVALYAERNL